MYTSLFLFNSVCIATLVPIFVLAWLGLIQTRQSKDAHLWANTLVLATIGMILLVIMVNTCNLPETRDNDVKTAVQPASATK